MNYVETTIEALQNSKRAVVQVSGGKDSLAMVELLRPHLRPCDRVLMLLTDDAPSAVHLISQELLEEFGERFEIVYSESSVDRRVHGDPSPVVLSDQPLFADVANTRTAFDCCYKNIMAPLHQATLSLEPDLIIRGQKECDSQRSPVRHLDVIDGITFCYPVHDWSDEKVKLFLADRLPEFYDVCSDAPDCETCTGYWGRGHQEWLQRVSPAQAEIRKNKIKTLLQAISPALMLGFREVE